MQVSISPSKSGNMITFEPLHMTEMLDMTEMTEKLDGFAQRLKDLRKQKNLSQTDLGQLAGLHYTHIGRFERGTSRPSGDTLKRLAEALGVTSDYRSMAPPTRRSRHASRIGNCSSSSRRSSNCPTTTRTWSRSCSMPS